jgi:hypothetical protein
MQRAKGQEHVNTAAEYAIHVIGPLDRRWTGSLPEMDIAALEMPDGSVETRITGHLPDQAALRGILCRLWDLGLTITRLERMKAGGRERSS